MTATVRDERRRGLLRHAIVVLGAALVTPVARAHAIVESSQPAANAVVAPGELRVRVRFSSRIDAARSRLTLIGPDGRQTTLVLGAADEPGVLTATVQPAARGRYTLHWQVLSVDGHVTRGDIPFRVDAGAGR
jgi:methionine-rich copper-binding protein CopC